MIEFTASKNQKLSTLIKTQAEGLTYSKLMKALRKKDVKINGVRVSKDVTLSIGDSVIIYATINPVKSYNVLYIDQNILVVDKFDGCTSESVFNQILADYKEAYFIHRLDRNTQGVLIFALNKQTEEQLLQGFKNRLFDKKYHALVYGKMPRQEDLLTAYLVKDSAKAEVKIYDKKVPSSVQIKTGYKVLKCDNGVSLLEVTLYTGKTHQIRAHLAYIGHFIIGDGKYGDNKINAQYNAKSQKLIAKSLTLKFDKNSALYYLNEKTFFSEFEI